MEIIKPLSALVPRNATSFDMLFYTSFSVNICVILYLLLFSIANQIVLAIFKATSTGLAGKFVGAHKNKQQLMHNVYFDVFIYTCMVCVTTVLILTTKSMDTPFQINSNYSVHILFAAITGVYIFLFVKEIISAPAGPNKWMNTIVYGITLAVVATSVITREDTVLVTIIVISSGDSMNANAAMVMKKVLSLEGSGCHRIATFMGTYATVVFRALLPIGFVVLALINGNPFNMSYPSVFFFFVGLLFFGALNTWQVNAALSRICNKGASNTGTVRTREVHAIPKPEDRDIIAGIELPPTYDEVCGGADVATADDVTDSSGGESGTWAAATRDIQTDTEIELHRRQDSIGSVESGLGKSSTHLNIIPPSYREDYDARSESTDDSSTKEQDEDFVDIDLGVPTAFVDFSSIV